MIQARRFSEIPQRHPPLVRTSDRCHHAAEAAQHHTGILPVSADGGHLGVPARRMLLEAWRARRRC